MKKYIISLLALIGLATGTWFGYANLAGANPSFFSRGTATATATSTLRTQTPGTGTSTVNLSALVSGNTQTLDSAQLLVQWIGSSTASTLKINIECSDDNIDFYQNCGGGVATSTIFVMAYASTTSLGGQGLSELPKTFGAVVNTIVYTVNTPLRNVRAIISTPIGSLNNMVWAQFIAKRQQ